MSANPSKAALSPHRRRFVEFLQTVNFGRVESLRIEYGEPILDPPPKTIIEFKFLGENGPRPELAAADFALKSSVVELFRHFDRIRDGRIDVLEVKHGLPFRMMLVN